MQKYILFCLFVYLFINNSQHIFINGYIKFQKYLYEDQWLTDVYLTEGGYYIPVDLVMSKREQLNYCSYKLQRELWGTSYLVTSKSLD